jgi:hypothetical protein
MLFATETTRIGSRLFGREQQGEADCARITPESRENQKRQTLVALHLPIWTGSMLACRRTVRELSYLTEK